MDEVLELPGLSGAAMQVLSCLDDPGTSASDVGQHLQTDQALSTKAVYIANSAFYGRASPVNGPGEAAAVLGFDTIRSLAAGVAFGVFSAREGVLPRSYWEHAVTTAASASVLARHMGISSADAFSAGLLHDLGAALISIRRPGPSRDLRARAVAERKPLSQLEEEEFGIDHATLGQVALDAARFPERFVHAVTDHHGPAGQHETELGAVVAAADVIALGIRPGWYEGELDAKGHFATLGLDDNELESMVEACSVGADQLAGFVGLIRA